MPEAEWNDERTRIICELFEEQVRAGNRPNTHLNNIGYREVAAQFQRRTQLFYTKMQLKNKWDKLKGDYITWKKLLTVGSGKRWDTARGTFAADDEWWKKTNKDLLGARRFRNAGLQNEDKLKVMFDYITSNGVDPSPPALDSSTNDVSHSPRAGDGLPPVPDSLVNDADHSPVFVISGLPSSPDSAMNGVDYSSQAADGLPYALEIPRNGVNLGGSDNNAEDNDYTHPAHETEPPSRRNKKRPIRVNAMKNKKSKDETALLLQTHLNRISDLAQKAQATFEKFSSRADLPRPTIQDVMTLVRECGARCGSNEHFIATELFVSKEQREMFLTMETHEERFQWLRRKYIAKYLSNLGPR